MTHDDFRRLQRVMDDLGLITSINRSGRNSGRRYEVIINGQIIKKCKQRITAKRRILAEFSKVLKLF